MASETVDPIDWSHPSPSLAVPPERLVHNKNQCTSAECTPASGWGTLRPIARGAVYHSQWRSVPQTVAQCTPASGAVYHSQWRSVPQPMAQCTPASGAVYPSQWRSVSQPVAVYPSQWRSEPHPVAQCSPATGTVYPSRWRSVPQPVAQCTTASGAVYHSQWRSVVSTWSSHQFISNESSNNTWLRLPASPAWLRLPASASVPRDIMSLVDDNIATKSSPTLPLGPKPAKHRHSTRG